MKHLWAVLLLIVFIPCAICCIWKFVGSLVAGYNRRESTVPDSVLIIAGLTELTGFVWLSFRIVLESLK